jgi:exopolysaccharide biosynthesis polyprenyl glycosylphosphotransferase
MTATGAVTPPRRDGEERAATNGAAPRSEQTSEGRSRALADLAWGARIENPPSAAGEAAPVADAGENCEASATKLVHQLRPVPPVRQHPVPPPLNRRVSDIADGLVPRRPTYDPFSARRRPLPEWLVNYTSRLVAGDALAASLGAQLVAVTTGGISLPASLVVAVAWCAVVFISGGYAERFLSSGTDEYRRIAVAGLVVLAGLGLVVGVQPIPEVRGMLLVGVPMLTAVTLVLRHLQRRALHRSRRRGYMRKQVVLVGRTAAVLDLAQRLRRDPEAGYDILGACVPDPDAEQKRLRRDGVPVLGTLNHVPQVLDNVRADAVVVASVSDTAAQYLRQLAWQLEGTKIEVLVAPGLIEVAPDRLRVRPTKTVPLLHLQEPEYRGKRRLLKALVDRVLASTLLILFAPVLIVLMVLVVADSRGPVFYRHRRVGKRGREFDLLKFRSMRVGADRQLDELVAMNQGNDVQFKLRRDPRATRVGHFLRRYSLDELPQLINVVRGDMSLVGPRPHVTREVEQYGDDMHRRLLVKPGITGLWQVSGRSDLTWAESVELDVRYVDNWSLGRDLAILWRTARAVVQGSGAY